METDIELVKVTPQKLDEILDQVESEQLTSLAIVGPDSKHLFVKGITSSKVLELTEFHSGIANRVASLRQLQCLALVGLRLNSSDANGIAKNLTRLTSLDVSGNDIGEAGVRAIINNNKQLTSLGIAKNKIGEAGACVIAEQLPHLTALNVNDNQIREVGAFAIAEKLKSLSMLHASNNQIGNAGAIAIAENLGILKTLGVHSNGISVSGVTAIAKRLSQLTKLVIGSNKIGDSGVSEIAAHLGQLTHLFVGEVNLGQATIEIISKRLRRLNELGVWRNKNVIDIGPLSDMPELRTLGVEETSVSDLEAFAERIADGWPVFWDFRDQNYGLHVRKCPLVRPTVEIARQGPDAVRNYFRELAEQGEDYLYEAKVLILGEGGAGKTSLLRCLYQPDRELPKEDETTRGISIHRQDFIGNGGQPFRLNVWDFGGQQIYHATHQFFLTKNSLYVLVDDTRKDDKNIHDEGFKFWLEVVETLSDGSPLLIFQNEKGDRSKDIDKPGIQGRFNNVKEVYCGNLERLGSVKSLRQAIEHYVQQLPHIGERVPKKWVSIRQELEQISEKKPFISQDEYFTVYGHHLAFDRNKALYLSRYLHDLGVFLHFQDDEVLSKTVILQNQWATEAVFRILDDEAIKKQRGRFTASDCKRLWSASAYADMHFELRGLMEKFELCYRLAIPNTKQWLAPQLLSPSKPPELMHWAKPDDLVVRYKYPFLPRGLVSRLMVRQHRFVRQLENCWAHGSFFEHNGTEVLVDETTKGNEIELRGRGPENKALLSVLSSDLEALNDSFKGLQGRVEKLVPCICSICRQTTTPEMFEHSLLVNRQHGGKKKTIECRKSEEDIVLLELLDGLKLEYLPTWATKPKLTDEAQRSNKSSNECDENATNDNKTSMTTGLKTIKIFLASSEELKEDRDQFDLYFRQQNDHFKEQGKYLQIVRWEHFLDTISETRKQDDYNNALRECDIVVCLFKTKVGKFTEEEFDEALKKFQSAGKPKILTFFRDFELSGDEIKSKRKDLDSLHAFPAKAVGHWSLLDQVFRYRKSETAVSRSANANGHLKATISSLETNIQRHNSEVACDLPINQLTFWMQLRKFTLLAKFTSLN